MRGWLARWLKAKGASPTPSPDAAFNDGLAAHQSGRLAEAEAIYTGILRLAPDHFNALHFLGVLAIQDNRPDEGIRLIRHALTINPSDANAHFNLAKALHLAGHHAESLTLYDRTIALNPAHTEAHLGRGAVLQHLERYQEALASYEAAIRLKPDYAGAHVNRGLVLHTLGRTDAALASQDIALKLRPDDPNGHFHRGNYLRGLQRREEALLSLEQAIRLRPGYPEALANRAVILRELGRYEEALADQDKAIAAQPGLPGARSNRGAILQEMGRPAEALAAFDEAIADNPDSAGTWSNRGVVLMELRRLAESDASFERAIALDPTLASARWNRGLLHLNLGRYQEGWEGFEWRHRLDQPIGGRTLPVPIWTGEQPLAGKTILLHWEQGFGDTLQFCRYAPLVQDLGARVILSVQDPLRALIARMSPGLTVVGPRESPTEIDFHCSLMSLPRAFGTTLETVPARIPYLHADEIRARAWRDRLSGESGLKIGLVWAGGARPDQPQFNMIDRRRSLALDALAPLGTVPGVTFISLQKGPPSDQLRAPPAGLKVQDPSGELGDFDDTAALISALDLVITVDTAVAHLAGALGKPVWILNRYDTCWRWLENRSDSPWYPSARLFRQREPGIWTPVIEAVRQALTDLAAERR